MPEITDLLKSKGLYEDADSILIDELLYQYHLIHLAKKNIKQFGIMVNVRADGDPLLQVNQAVGIYQQSVKNLITIIAKLGISPQERNKLKLFDKKIGFDLGKFLQGGN